MSRLRLPRRALLASAAAAAIAVPEKPSIYPNPQPEILLLETPSELEKQIGAARRRVTGVYSDAHARVQDVVSRWIGVEHAVESRVKSLVDPTEPLTPGLLYVGISTLTGSILARNRRLPTRILLPSTLLLFSLQYFLPKTASNISAYSTELEERYVPRVAEIHATANAHTRMTWERVKEGTRDGRERVGRGVDGAVGWVQGATGLKLREALGWGEGVLKEAEERTVEAVGAAQAKAVEATQALSAKAEQTQEKVEDGKNAASEKVEEVKKKLV